GPLSRVTDEKSCDIQSLVGLPHSLICISSSRVEHADQDFQTRARYSVYFIERWSERAAPIFGAYPPPSRLWKSPSAIWTQERSCRRQIVQNKPGSTIREWRPPEHLIHACRPLTNT